MIILGIDPGLKGGLAIIVTNKSSHTVTAIPMLELKELRTYLTAVKPDHVFLEKAQAMPGQGVSSMFNYGVGYGSLLGLLMALLIPHTLVAPRAWARQMHQGTSAGEPKKRSLEAATRLFPDVNLIPPRCRKPHEGIIDALLIAEYGRRQLGTVSNV